MPCSCFTHSHDTLDGVFHRLQILCDAVPPLPPTPGALFFLEFSFWIDRREALGALGWVCVRSPGPDPQPTPPNSISRLAALEGSRQHAEIWKVLNNLLVEGGRGGGSGRPGGGGGIVKTGGWGREETECKIVHIPPFCLALFLVPSHTDNPPP